MKNSILFIISFLVISCAKAQLITNYVKNPDFEKYDTCPYKNDQINVVKFWTSVDSTYNISAHGNCSAEYYNACANSTAAIDFRIPFNQAGYQYPRSGKGMIGGYMFCDETPPMPAPEYYYRDYPQARLFKPLQSTQNYCVTFYVNLATISTYATNKIGAYLDDGTIDTVSICSKPITFVKPQVYTNDVVDDTLNWIKIEGSFTANGTERFITLGNFFSIDSLTYTIPLGVISNQHGYYFIDDVSVIESDLPADAGEDRWVEMGKQVEIGRVGDTTAIGLDCKWYHKGVVIDSGAIITVNANAVKNAVDTYVVVQTICGLVKTDTVTVKTAGVGIPLLGGARGGFNVYPNPSNGTFIISSPLAVIPRQAQLASVAQGTLNATVYDLLGRIIHQQNLYFINKEASLNLNLPNASYILELKDEAGNVQRERIVIQ